MKDIVWVNLENYSVLELSLFFAGAILWVVGYIAIIVAIRKKQFVEMPAVALAGNFAWEILWAFFFKQDMGFVIDIGYKLWFFLDLYIAYSFYKYGYKQLEESLKPYYKAFFSFALVSWFSVLYLFIYQGIDNPIGANSAYLLNLMMSSVYVIMFLRMKDKSVFSFTVAWSKGLGTALITVMCFLKWPENHWLILMGIYCFILDVLYVYLLRRYKKTLA